MTKSRMGKLPAVFLMAAALTAAALLAGACDEAFSGDESAPLSVGDVCLSFVDQNGGDEPTAAIVNWSLPENSEDYNGVFITFEMLDSNGEPSGKSQEARITDKNTRTEDFDLPAHYDKYQYGLTIWAVNSLGAMGEAYHKIFPPLGIEVNSGISNNYKRLIFCPNEKAGGEGDKQTEWFPVGERFRISGVSLFTNKYGLTFAGWSTEVNEDGETTGTYFHEGEEYTFDSNDAPNLTLNAAWADGSAEYPYLIWRQDNQPGGLEYITTSGLGQNYKIAQDFTITPPYTAPVSFKGILDGNGHTITWNVGTTLLTPTPITVPQYQYKYGVGIIATIGGSYYPEIKNLVVKGDIKFTSSDGRVAAGGIAGYASQAIITNCHSEVNIEYVLLPAQSDYQPTDIGGILGAGEVQVRNCYTTGEIISYSNAGGIEGMPTGSTYIQSSYSTAKIISLSSASSYAGGIAGGNDIKTSYAITNCAALNPNVSGAETVSRIATSSGIRSSNYGNSAMTGGTWTPSEDGTGADGADVALAETKSAVWWQDTLSWTSAMGDPLHPEYGPRDVWGGDKPSEAAPWVWYSAKERPVLWFEAAGASR